MTTKMKSKKTPKTIWIGTVEGIFGYGISVIDESEKGCLKAIKKSYTEQSESRGHYDTYEEKFHPNGKPYTRFEKAMEYWGMHIREIEIGKTYFDNFNE